MNNIIELKDIRMSYDGEVVLDGIDLSLIELQKWQKEEKQNVFGFRFNDYLNMMQGAGDTCDGLAINPSGNNLVLSKDMILNIFMIILQKSYLLNMLQIMLISANLI